MKERKNREPFARGETKSPLEPMQEETTVLALEGNHPFLSRALAAFTRIAAATCACRPP
jgi:hypothetical protein